MNDDQDLRSLLHDAVSDVHPQHGPDALHGHIGPPSATRWLPLTVAAAAAVVLVIGGTAWAKHLSDRQPAVAGPSAPTSSASARAGRDLNVPVYYVGDTAAGPRLFVEYHEVRDTTDSPLQAAVNEALTVNPEDPDYENLFQPLGVTATVSEGRQEIAVDLSRPVDRQGRIDAETARLMVQALVWTADSASNTTDPVNFLVGGEAAESVLGVGTATRLEQQSADSVLSTVSIDSPQQGSDLSTTFEVRGQAATFEANVVWELVRGTQVVKHGFTTATECCTLSPYSFTVTVPPGDYTLRVHDVDESDGEGVGTSEDTKDITVKQGF